MRRLWHALLTLAFSVRYWLRGGMVGVLVDGHDYGEPTYRMGTFDGRLVEWEDLRCRCGHLDSGWRAMA